MKMRSFALASLLGMAVLPTNAATIDLTSQGLQLGSLIGESSNMSIIDTAPLDLGFIIPGSFQASDFVASPALEVNTGDGVQYSFSATPGVSGTSVEIAREGDRQLEFLFELAGGTSDAFGRLILADGDSLDSVLTGFSFSDASFSVWNVEAAASTDLKPIPLPAGLPLLLAGLGGFAVLKRAKTRKA